MKARFQKAGLRRPFHMLKASAADDESSASARGTIMLDDIMPRMPANAERCTKARGSSASCASTVGRPRADGAAGQRGHGVAAGAASVDTASAAERRERLCFARDVTAIAGRCKRGARNSQEVRDVRRDRRRRLHNAVVAELAQRVQVRHNRRRIAPAAVGREESRTENRVQL